MANATINLHFTKSGYVKQSEPYTVFPTDSNTFYQVSNPQLMYFGVEAMPQALRHNALISMYAKVAAGNYGYLSLYPCVEDFDPETLTYSNKPDIDNTVYHFSFSLSGSSDQLRDLVSPTITHEATIKSFFRYKTSQLSGSASAARFPNVRTVLADETTLPGFVVTYDDSAIIKSKIVLIDFFTASINGGVAHDVTWDFQKDTSAVSGFCADETWAQRSATFYWRNKDTEQTFHSIPISGTQKGVTIPAGTFPSGAYVQYYVEGTDEDGTTTNTETYTTFVLANKIAPTNSPTSGYVNPRNETIFSWVYQSSAGTAPAGNTSLFWRASGSDSWTEVQAATGSNSLTIPANTFPTASTIQWYLSGTDSTGYASQTSVYSFSTAAGAVTAQAVSPSNTVQSNNQAITFNWDFSSSDGFAPSRYKFLWKLATDTEYTTLLDETTIVTEYTFQAYTFPAGEIQWMIIPYNIDGVEGTGQATTFICYGAPEAPVVYVENTPFTTVRWQANDQQAYQIRVDDTVYGPYFGTEKTFELPDKLEDGEHSISVSIVGTYGLWSDWGTSVINVQNAPGEEIVLTGVSGIDNMLSWETEEATADFLIFRDGVQIGHTARTTFADRYASGEHSYQVLNRLTDGNYSESNTVTLETTAAGTYITERVGGEWLEIKYSKMDMRDPDYEETADGTFYHLAGNTYPSGSLSGFRESKVNFSALFLAEQETDRKRFESLLGKEVILKFRDGTVFQTILNNWTKELKKLSWTTYSFALQRIETEDYVDDTT